MWLETNAQGPITLKRIIFLNNVIPVILTVGGKLVLDDGLHDPGQARLESVPGQREASRLRLYYRRERKKTAGPRSGEQRELVGRLDDFWAVNSWTAVLSQHRNQSWTTWWTFSFQTLSANLAKKSLLDLITANGFTAGLSKQRWQQEPCCRRSFASSWPFFILNIFDDVIFLSCMASSWSHTHISLVIVSPADFFQHSTICIQYVIQ